MDDPQLLDRVYVFWVVGMQRVIVHYRQLNNSVISDVTDCWFYAVFYVTDVKHKQAIAGCGGIFWLEVSEFTNVDGGEIRPI